MRLIHRVAAVVQDHGIEWQPWVAIYDDQAGAESNRNAGPARVWHLDGVVAVGHDPSVRIDGQEPSDISAVRVGFDRSASARTAAGAPAGRCAIPDQHFRD